MGSKKTRYRLKLNQKKAAAKIIGLKDISFENFPDQQFDTVPLLTIVKTIEAHIKKIKPHTIYTHHRGDLNKDHRICFEAVMTACRPIGTHTVKEIYSFECLSSTEWSEEKTFNPNVFVDVSKTIDTKVKALAAYKSEMRPYPHPRSVKGAEILAEYRGLTISTKHAEAFELVRTIV